ncbi:MAG: Lrp/AsnC family transcriptional regulator, partial [Paracoccaceae bacterium]
MIDNMDKALLAAVQRDSQLTAQDLGELLNLSPSQAARRRQKLESEGYISGYRAHINAEQLGLQVQAFIQVQLSTHGPEQGRARTPPAKLRTRWLGLCSMLGGSPHINIASNYIKPRQKEWQVCPSSIGFAYGLIHWFCVWPHPDRDVRHSPDRHCMNVSVEPCVHWSLAG